MLFEPRGTCEWAVAAVGRPVLAYGPTRVPPDLDPASALLLSVRSSLLLLVFSHRDDSPRARVPQDALQCAQNLG